MSSWMSSLSSRRGSNSEKSVSRVRLFFEAARNAAIAAIVLGGLTQLVFRNTIVTGIVGWVVFLAVLVAQRLLFNS